MTKKKIKPIKVTYDIWPPQPVEDKLELFKNKINEIIEVINNDA